MSIPWSVRPHGRWRKQLDAYIDGELSPAQSGRFEAHLASCARCAREVEAARLLKAALQAIPQVPAPRSFRLTPQMAADLRPERVVAVRPSRLPLLVAQVATGIAVAAFATVFAFDHLSSNSSSNGSQASAPLAASASVSATPSQATTAGGAASPSAEKRTFGGPLETPSATPSPTATPGVASPNSPGVLGQGVPSASPTMPPPFNPAPTPPAPNTGGPSVPAAPTSPPGTPASPIAPPGPATQPAPAPHQDFGPATGPTTATPIAPGVAPAPLAPATGSTPAGGSSWYVPTEAGLAALALLALFATLILARRRRN
ncbi:MAG TPA: zf-HC2 domain-containing protein [Tepidiformaceae bacterium]|nr:zf-HC2 domain-containing protein [Tepidiformaceae bacterium]